jgi:signal transduction histidine kinase
MSYRTIKRLLGETGLEFKFRMLFATGLLLLLTGSFYCYSQLTLKVVRAQQRERAQLLIGQNVISVHWKESVDPEHADLITDFNKELKPEDVRDVNWRFIPVDYENEELYDASNRPSEQSEIDAFKQIIQQGALYVLRRDEATNTYEYYEPIRAGETCLRCHDRASNPPGPTPYAKAGLLGVAKINFSLEATDEQIGYNMGILWALAIVTAVLAMAGSAVIVRYVIVKPVQHLNQVSEAIAHGDLDQRADIRTGDEFEELSHAFNRMLRHLVTIQDELRQVNSNLDAKVDELAQVNLNLHEMNKLKSEFLATMSHELRTPLNSILGFSEVLCAAENLNDRQRKYVTNIRASGQNLLALINDILDLAKIEAGKMELHPSEFALPLLVEHVTASLLPLAERKNIDLQCQVAPELRKLRQDHGKLQQILNNLLSNAVKFTPEGGRIRVSALPSGQGEFDLVVADTGVGIPLEDQATIFEKFRQGRNVPGQRDALTRAYEGTGLGLSIVKELCKLLGGEVLLHSEFGKGSTFTVRLPLEIDVPQQRDPDSASMSAVRPARAAS